jgi:acetyl-CoA decarbonylase/synthase complex subunit gamma
VVSTKPGFADKLGGIKARWDIGRMDYKVLPGLYAVGEPGPESPVFVTANYKMSFDALRGSLAALDGWILVLDTKGINVWCAAGKGSFGTEELVSRVAKVKLASVVSHRRLVLPQLGAPGVSAPEVARRSGFRVEWGPVRARDIPAWLAAGRVKTEAMREVTFDLADRMAVSPVEIAHAWPILLAGLALAALYGLPFAEGWQAKSLPAAVLLLGIIPIGTIAFPALLPWLPARAFAIKGAFLGAVWALAAAAVFSLGPLATLAGLLVAAPVTAFLAMNFTGASTYTCQPGALIEVEKGFWPMLASLGSGLAAGGAARIFGL